MSQIQKCYPETRFGGFTDIDGTCAFFLRLNSLLDANAVVLDLGCGRGEYAEDPVRLRRELRILKGKVAKVIGADFDPVAASNPYLDEFRQLKSDTWDLPDNSVDLILCDHVMEHVESPKIIFNEARRVLRPGGHLCIRTPNKWSYVAISARIIPNRLHSRVVSLVQEDRKEEDVFPTHYRCNTASALRRQFRDADFSGVAYGYEAEPDYLEFSGIVYRLGVLHQRLAPKFLKPILFAFATLNSPPLIKTMERAA